MDEDARTVWCGNLSEKVTEDILYELFLQGGPVQKVSIPKDRDGKQRTFGFITYKHLDSVAYALKLFDGTCLFNRCLSMKTRNNMELPPTEKSPLESAVNLHHVLQLGQQMILGNFPQNMDLPMYNNNRNMLPGLIVYPSQVDRHSYSDDRRSRAMHPYRREDNKRDRRNDNDYKDHRSHRNRYDNGRNSDNYSNRHNNYKGNRKGYR